MAAWPARMRPAKSAGAAQELRSALATASVSVGVCERFTAGFYVRPAAPASRAEASAQADQHRGVVAGRLALAGLDVDLHALALRQGGRAQQHVVDAQA